MTLALVFGVSKALGKAPRTATARTGQQLLAALEDRKEAQKLARVLAACASLIFVDPASSDEP